MDDLPKERGAKQSLLVTGIFLLLLLVLAAALKPSKNSPQTAATEKEHVQPIPELPGPGAASADSAKQISGQPMLPGPIRNKPPVPRQGTANLAPNEIMSVPAEKQRQQILTDCRIKEDNSNDGDSFSVLTRSGEYRFSLYYINAPDRGQGTIQEMKDHCDYFGLNNQQVSSVAHEAKAYVEKILAKRKFDVVTRWERAPEESPNGEITCRAFILFEGSDGRMVNLATLLVHEGLASICSGKEVLPDGTAPVRFITELQALETDACNQKRGAWHFQNELGTVETVKYQTR